MRVAGFGRGVSGPAAHSCGSLAGCRDGAAARGAWSANSRDAAREMAAMRCRPVAVGRQPAGWLRLARSMLLASTALLATSLPLTTSLLLTSITLPAQQQPAAELPETVTVVAFSDLAKLSGDRLARQRGVAARRVVRGDGRRTRRDRRGAAGNDTVAVVVTKTDRGLHLRSELLERGRSLGVRSSWLPAGSLGAVTATAAGDGFLLWSQARRFPDLRDLGTPRCAARCCPRPAWPGSCSVP